MSDIDVLFIKSFSKTEVKKILIKINVPYQKKFHIIEQDIKDFMKDLKDKDELSIASEIYKQPPIIFYGESIFFKIILEDKW